MEIRQQHKPCSLLGFLYCLRVVFGELCVWGDRASQPQDSITLSVLAPDRDSGPQRLGRQAQVVKLKGKRRKKGPQLHVHGLHPRFPAQGALSTKAFALRLAEKT